MERRRQYGTEQDLEILRGRSRQSDPEYREEQKAMEKQLDQMLHGELTTEDLAFRDALQEALNIEDRLTVHRENYIAAYMRRLPRHHVLWRVLAVVGLPNFYFLLMVFAQETKRTVQFPSKSKLHDAVLAEYVFEIKGRNPKWKNTEIAQEITNTFSGQRVSAEKVNYILRNRRKFESQEALWRAEVEDLQTLARILHAKHRLIHGLD